MLGEAEPDHRQRPEDDQHAPDEGGATGDRPVAAQGPFGTIVSEGFRLENRGQVVVFTGNAKAVLEGGR